MNDITNSITNSASKLVFILMAAATCAGLFLGKIDPKDFLILASMAFSYYFAVKASDGIAGGK